MEMTYEHTALFAGKAVCHWLYTTSTSYPFGQMPALPNVRLAKCRPSCHDDEVRQDIGINDITLCETLMF